MDFYWITFIVVVKVAIVFAYANSRSGAAKSVDQSIFQTYYLVVHTLAHFADWLKGPYMYALYQSYGLDEKQIAYLFIAGFGASGVVGPFLGVLADRFGRKQCSMAYFIVYILSALCKPYNNICQLFAGRVLGGIATSLLTTVLESWMVAEHHRRQYTQELLDDTFAKATLYNSFSAVVAGLLAQVAADRFGYLAPFMLAISPLSVGLIICWRKWTPDPPKETISVFSGFRLGLRSMDDNLWILGITQSLFLGAMYTFVFLWTPAVDAAGDASPYGIIFATFMAMISIGSSLFKRVSHVVEKIPGALLSLSAGLMGAVILTLDNQKHVFITFALFEMMCGLMFPTYASLRSIYIPNEYRTIVMNIYRIPLNAFVIIVLLNKKNMSLQLAFGVCSGALASAALLWRHFRPEVKTSGGKQYARGHQIDQEADFGDTEEFELDSDASIESD